MNNWVSAPDNQVLAVASIVAIAGIPLLWTECRTWKKNRAASADHPKRVRGRRFLIVLRASLALLSIGFFYVINGYIVFGVPFAHGILEHKPFGRDFVAPWLPFTVALNACAAALLPELAIAFFSLEATKV
jgi:hypothetical protein